MDLHVIEIAGKKYNFYSYKENIMVSWLSFEDENDKKLKRINFLDLLRQVEIESLSQDQKKSLCFELINKRKFITNAKELDFILTKYPIVESYIAKDHCVNIIKDNDDVKVFANLIKNLSKESGIFIIEELSENFVKRMLAYAFLYANIETRIKEIPKNYIYDLSPLAVQEVNSLTHHLLRNLIDNEFRQFENFYFPQFKSVDYLNRFDFSYCNLKKAFFAQSISHCDFNSAYLDEVKFLMKLTDISFSNVNLKTTEFLGADYFKFEEITLYKATLSTQSFKRLLKADVFDFSYANLAFFNFQDILKTQIKLDFSHANLEGIDLSHLNLKKQTYWIAFSGRKRLMSIFLYTGQK